MNKKAPVVNLEVGNQKEAKIVFLGDIHYGHNNCSKDSLKETITYVKNNRNAYVVLMGDLIELAIENHLPGSMYTQEMTPNQQRKDMVELLKPIKHRIIGGIAGNHEITRGWKLNSISPMEIMCEGLNIPYWGIGGYLIINLRKKGKVLQTYKLLLFHGVGNSTTPQYLINKALKIYTDPDVVAMGHSHNLSSGSNYFVVIDEVTHEIKQKEIVWIRTGSYLNSPDYAIEKLYPPSAIGSPIALLQSNEKVVYVNYLKYLK